MCNQVKSTLETAILETVREFGQQGKSFSAHDITTVIRRKCNAGELEIPTAATSGGNIKFYISHAEVNGIFKDLYRNGVFNPEFTLDKQINPTGQYFIYTPQPSNGVTYASTTTATPPVATPSTAPATPVIATVIHGKSTLPVIKVRVAEYLTNCKSKCICPTLKEVQSAIKRDSTSNGWTCNELLDVCVQLGYSVITDVNFVSKSLVATV